MTPELLLNVVEAALLAAGRPVDVDELLGLFADQSPPPNRKQMRAALDNLQTDLEGRALELKQVAGGYRLQVREEYSKHLSGLFTERPTRYSRALQETLALIAYRQPVTRGEIEEVRGVVVSGNIIRTLLEREWIRVLGHREVPGRPALYGTTRSFLDHFNLKNLEELPPLAEIRDLDQIEPDLFANISTADEESNEDPQTAESSDADDEGDDGVSVSEIASEDVADSEGNLDLAPEIEIGSDDNSESQATIAESEEAELENVNEEEPLSQTEEMEEPKP